MRQKISKLYANNDNPQETMLEVTHLRENCDEHLAITGLFFTTRNLNRNNPFAPETTATSAFSQASLCNHPVLECGDTSPLFFGVR